LVDVNGDGLPDQLMKLPGDSYRVKLNTGAGFAAEVAFAADAWPGGAALFSVPSYVPIDKADVLGFSRGDSSSGTNTIAVASQTFGSSTHKTVIELMDIDGDGRVDQVLKNADL